MEPQVGSMNRVYSHRKKNETLGPVDSNSLVGRLYQPHPAQHLNHQKAPFPPVKQSYQSSFSVGRTLRPIQRKPVERTATFEPLTTLPGSTFGKTVPFPFAEDATSPSRPASAKGRHKIEPIPESKRKYRKSELTTPNAFGDIVGIAQVAASLKSEDEGVLQRKQKERGEDLKKLKDINDKTNPFWFIHNVVGKGGAATSEFVYLNSVSPPKSVDYNPYKLKIVPHSMVNKEDYFTLSASGVTHFVKNTADFIALEQWQREHDLFHQIITIPTFHKYRKWKAYSVWRNNVRSKKMALCENMLHNNLFILNTNLRQCLLHVRDLCASTSSLRLFKITPSTTYTLTEFVAHQEQHRVDVTATLTNIMKTIRLAVWEACETALENAGFGAEISSAVKDALQTSPRAKSTLDYSTSTRATQRLTYTEQAARRTECRRLTNFIKLVDYLIIEALHNLAVASVKDLLAHLSLPLEFDDKGEVVVKLLEELVQAAPEAALVPALDSDEPQEATPLFRVEILLSTDTLVFAPSADLFQDNLDAVIAHFVTVVLAVDRLVGHDDFKAYTQPVINDRLEVSELGEGPDLAAIILEDSEYQHVTSEIKSEVAAAFNHGDKYTRVFEAFCRMYLENQATRFHSAAEADYDLEFFKDAFIKYHAQQEQMAQMPVLSVVGIILIDSRQLKDQFLPSPLRCLQQVEELLPQLAHLQNTSLLNEVNADVKRLSSTPAAVEEFVDFLAFLDRVNDEQDELQARYNIIQEMYALMEKYKVKAPPEEFALFQTLAPTFSTLKASLSFSEASKDENVDKFSAELEQRVSKLHGSVMEVRHRGQNPMIASVESDMDEVLTYLGEVIETVDSLKQEAHRYQEYQTIFKLPVSKFDDLDDVANDINLKQTLWVSMKEWLEQTQQWISQPFEAIDAEELAKHVQRYAKVVAQLEKGLDANSVVPRLKALVEEFKLIVPIVLDLRNQYLKPRHWDAIQDVMNQRLVRDANFTLSVLLELNVADYKEEIAQISLEATNEAALEEMLAKVEGLWANTEFVVNTHKEHKDVYILGGVDDIMTGLEDSMITISTIRGSRYMGPVKAQVEEWERSLSLFSETLEEWINCQRDWLYLENIFTASDIQRQLPNETKLFMQVDKSWKDVMRGVFNNPQALRAATQDGLLAQLKSNNAALAQIMKCLEEYLETKRLGFPRFYFLSNDELLEILAQTKHPQAVQPHLKKCFDNINKLEFVSADGKSVDIVAMVSAENERIGLGKNLKARGNVETWLSQVEQHMIVSLKKLTKTAIAEYMHLPRPDWVLETPAMLVIVVSQVFWAREVEQALESPHPVAALQDLHAVLLEQLSALTLLVRGNLSRLQRLSIGALLTIDVHARDVVEQMIEEGVSGVTDFGWTKRLRYYWSEEADVVVRQTNAHFNFGYEYLGATPRLVITPLTDRCYITLTSALKMYLGGAPAGPAGTGKTETVRDLAKALGRQCIVFNCSEGLDYKIMGGFFAGLAQSGSWICFDEFNRIDIEVLSVISQQILTVKQALSSQATRFMFEGREIPLVPTCGVFITMNPGYAGRTELPDNLKSQFRPVVMMVPDYTLIAEIVLFSEGFVSAKPLSKKVTLLYRLSSEQLSKQDHYDFGMRALKTVLVMAGSIKRSHPDLDEEIVLIRSLTESNVPKFLAEDLPLFYGILGDLFPGIKAPEHDYGHLRRAIEDVLVENNLQVVPALVAKVLQLYETIQVRHGIMLVGPAGGGKTTCTETLAQALTLMNANGHEHPTYQKTRTFRLNPKCISMGELYGEFNVATHEWVDGLAASIVRTVVSDVTPDYKWVVFDGPVDALWIENMNSVLDDNKTLCLANGERIKVTDSIRLMFEVADLAVASPATVSRCGMVYMQPKSLGWRPSVVSWINSRLEKTAPLFLCEYIMQAFDKYVEKGLIFIRENCAEAIASEDHSLVATICSLLESLLLPDRQFPLDIEEDEVRRLADMLFAFCYIWGLGGNLLSRSQDVFDSHVRQTFEGLVTFPQSRSVFSVYLDPVERSFRPWEDIVVPYVYSPTVPYNQILVPTVDTARFDYLMRVLMDVDRPVLLNGVSGTGKSVMVSQLLNSLKERDGTVPSVLQFSARTSSIRTQELMEARLEKRRKTVLTGPGGKKVAMFVDDINMPALDSYGSQPPVELLRQFIDFGGFYDRTKLFWKKVQDVKLLAACAPPGGGRNKVTPRLTRHFALLHVPPHTEETLQSIFTQILDGFLRHNDFHPDIRAVSKSIVMASLELYNRMQAEMRPTPAKSHYTFNLRDLSKVFQGLLQVTPLAVSSKPAMLRLWSHEAHRVFHDRLVSPEDRDYFYGLETELFRRHFETAWNPAENDVIFADFLRTSTTGPPVYEECEDINKLYRIVDDYLDDYNMSSNKEMKLVLFRIAVVHLTRISRIIRQPGGNALLVGLSGCGKQSLTRLAAHIADYECFQIELTRNYGPQEFREDLRTVFVSAGVKAKHIVFLLSDSQITTEAFLEDVNSILNSGEVPNLFDFEEYEKIISEMRAVAKAAGVPDQRELIYQYFIDRVKSHLHIVLCLSPVGAGFRHRCRMFPSLVNCCTIDWFDEWPEDALLSVANRFLAEVPLPTDEMRQAIVSFCVEAHSRVQQATEAFYDLTRRHVYVTPTSYLEFINLFIAKLAEKKEEKAAAIHRLAQGISKLEETNNRVGEMEEELKALEPLLKQKAEATEVLLKQLTKDQEVTDRVKQTVQTEEALVQSQTQEISAMAQEAQSDLDEALPALEAANRSLETLNKADITEIKSFTKPPELVQTVMSAVCILLNSPTDWPSAKTLLGDAGFLNRLINFDKDNIPPTTLRKLKKFIDDPMFQPSVVMKVSIAAKSLCMWVRAMEIYSKIHKAVVPKRERLAEAQRQLEESKAALTAKQAELKAVEDELAALRSQYETNVNEKQILQHKIEQTSKRLKRASKLTSALVDEHHRWSQQKQTIEAAVESIVGNSLLATA